MIVEMIGTTKILAGDCCATCPLTMKFGKPISWSTRDPEMLDSNKIRTSEKLAFQSRLVRVSDDN